MADRGELKLEVKIRFFFFVKRSCGFTGRVANKQCFHDALRDTGPLKSPGDQSSKWRVSRFVFVSTVTGEGHRRTRETTFQSLQADLEKANPRRCKQKEKRG